MLSWNEISSYLSQGGAQTLGKIIFQYMDQNQDGQLSQNEIGQYIFQLIDTNNDNIIQINEFTVALQ